MTPRPPAISSVAGPAHWRQDSPSSLAGSSMTCRSTRFLRLFQACSSVRRGLPGLRAVVMVRFYHIGGTRAMPTAHRPIGSLTYLAPTSGKPYRKGQKQFPRSNRATSTVAFTAGSGKLNRPVDLRFWVSPNINAFFAVFVSPPVGETPGSYPLKTDAEASRGGPHYPEGGVGRRRYYFGVIP